MNVASLLQNTVSETQTPHEELPLTPPTAMFNGQMLFDRQMHVKMVGSAEAAT